MTRIRTEQEEKQPTNKAVHFLWDRREEMGRVDEGGGERREGEDEGGARVREKNQKMKK